ncbi:MAG: class II aldolase/adducin family protein [Bacteroidales bacterium]|nr:class II aldolase/adducin family protein [Bacteroidales bacterium]
MITEKHIETFVAQAHRVGELGLTICSSGNLSWRIGDKALISGTGSWVPSLREDQVSICNVTTGEVLNGVKPSMESVFHLGVMRERPDVGVVLHFQSPYATQVACSEVRPKSYNVTAEVPLHVGRVIPEIPFYRPGSPELAEAVVNALRDRNSALMLKHGQVVCGKDFDDVIQRAMFFEMACRICVLADMHPAVLTEEEVDALEIHFLGMLTR